MAVAPTPAELHHDDLATARRVLELEATALHELGASLNGDFTRAVDLIVDLPGRLVISGMGKSGHVARKIAATLASTGTPAFFVHPAEASHGDLGMITRADAIMALSNSGETPELEDLVAYSRRFDIPLLGITRRLDSALGSRSDIALVVPDSAEACPNRQAPTTSTTQMMALGDALAVALMTRRGFSADDFRRFHPGGKLGQRILKVADVMHTGAALPLVAIEVSMAEALVEMTRKSFGCVGVTEGDGRLVGIVTDGDLRRHMAPDLTTRPVADIMTAAPKTIAADALAVEALKYMNGAYGRPVTSLFVVSDQRPVGLVHIHDCLRAGVA